MKVRTCAPREWFYGNQDAIAQRSSPRPAVGVDRHRALQRVGATGETKKAVQRLFGNQALT
jgi:hypothetical protein